MNVIEHDLHPQAQLIDLINPDAPQYTPDIDAQAVCWLAQRTNGNVVELGCHKGHMTARLCDAVPRKRVYGIDSCADIDPTLKKDFPECANSENEIGRAARRFANAAFMALKNGQVDYATLDDVTMIFIDSNHTYQGVKADTERALSFLGDLPADKKRFLVWHDYATEYMTGHPDWLQVGKYIRTEIAPRMQVHFVRRTTVAWTEWPSIPRIAIGVVTYNRLDLLKRCLPSWTATGLPVFIWDNGSHPETKDWIKSQPVEVMGSTVGGVENCGIAVARNRLLDRAAGAFDYLLLMDSDIELDPGCVGSMLETAEQSPMAAFVVGPQAIQDTHPVDNYGRVGQASGECMLYRLSAYDELGGFPAALKYYSSDSWAMTLAGMIGWWTVVSPLSMYSHYKHSSQINPGVVRQLGIDAGLWQRRLRTLQAFSGGFRQ